MTLITVHLQTLIRPTFRTHQVAGLFDLSLDDLAGERFARTLTAELPGVDEDWTIGAIVGPSGSGKTTLARAAFGDALYRHQPWPDDLPLIECFERSEVREQRSEGETLLTSDLCSLTSSAPQLPLKQILRTLTAVGLASPPSWLKPYHVLSTGERFRADLARAIFQVQNAECGMRNEETVSSTPHSAIRNPHSPSLLVFDEFTSTLDRTIACTASFALSKYLRSTECIPKFIALCCHTDFLPWLAPDWILDLANDQGPRTNDQGPIRPTWPRYSRERPELPLAIRRIKQNHWPRFAKHHYLSGGLSTAATCYGAFAEPVPGSKFNVQSCDSPPTLNIEPGTLNSTAPVAFCAVLATLGHRRTKHISRLVVLPEWQGLGIGPRLAEAVAVAEAAKGNRVTITASHPSILAWCSRSPRWKYVGLKKTGSTRQRLGTRSIRCSTGRAVASFEWVGAREGEAPAEP